MAHCRHFNTYLSQPKHYVSSQAIVETFIHEIEIMHWLLGEEYKSAVYFFQKEQRLLVSMIHHFKTLKSLFLKQSLV